MKKNLHFLLTILIFTVVFVNCKTDEPDTSKTETIDPIETFSNLDAAGVMVATKSYIKAPSTTGGIPGMGDIDLEIEVGTAVAVFGDLKKGTFNDAGEVRLSLNSQQYPLKKQSNNSYVSTPGLTDPQGIVFDDNIPFWDVPNLNFSKSSYYRFPGKPAITSGKTITKSEGYTFSISGSNMGDSIIYIIASNNSYVTKTKALQATNSVSFTASELSELKASKYALLQVTTYRIRKQTVTNKDYYMINQVVVSETVEVK
ncbi:MAG: hypothetical protein ACK5L7_01125 [Paludibacteraceae bacterium]